jgi:hypothetical protein
MNKIVKFLLVILAVFIIAGAGFWGGTQFAYRQVAVNAASQAAGTTPRWDGTQRGPGMIGPNANNRGWSEKNSTGRDGFGRGTFGPGMMGWNNFGPGMMNGSNGRFTGMFPGGLFLGGGLMFLGLLFPLGILVLIILGIIALFRVVRRPSTVVVDKQD